MIVLAGAIILSLNSSNIIGKASEAKTKVDMATVKEQIGIVKAETLLNDSAGNFSKINKGDLPIEISSNGEVSLTGNVDDKTAETFMDVFVETAPASYFNYSENDGKVTITGYTKKDDTTIKYLNIPSIIDGKPVVSIGSNVFMNCPNLINITIPNTVVSIGEFAFSNCYKLKNIKIPDSVIFIDRYAFEWCSGLTNINIPIYMTSISNGTFFGCGGLTSITIPNSVTSINVEAFGSCYNVTRIIIPDSVVSIGRNAFYFCDSLTSITIPNSVTSIEDTAFSWCSNLTSIKIKRPNDGTLTGAPWSAPNATVKWNYTGN
ncbi:MAG: leucine-rich repeat domain-containing protein [Clostridia bacterium]|nr:leucine-rich repeat domain-containing protein [Clostridia bacterium]